VCEAARAVLRRCAHAEPPEVGGRRGASPADGRGSGELSVKASNDRAQDLWGAKASVALELVECGGDVVKCEPVAVERVAACDDLSCSRIDEHEAPVAALLGAGLDELESMPPRPAAHPRRQTCGPPIIRPLERPQGDYAGSRGGSRFRRETTAFPAVVSDAVRRARSGW